MVKRYLPGTTEVRKERGRKDERKEGRNRKEGYTCINILLVEYRSPAPLLSCSLLLFPSNSVCLCLSLSVSACLCLSLFISPPPPSRPGGVYNALDSHGRQLQRCCGHVRVRQLRRGDDGHGQRRHGASLLRILLHLLLRQRPTPGMNVTQSSLYFSLYFYFFSDHICSLLFIH